MNSSPHNTCTIHVACLQVDNESSGPSLITVLIKMMLSPGGIDSDTQLFDDKDFQGNLQLIFVFAMLVSVPWMLVPKPFLLKAKHERQQRALQGSDFDEERPQVQFSPLRDDGEEQKESADDVAGSAAPKQGGGGHGHGHGEEFEFSEIFIHQLIHTIEYVLGTVSNTASYLRLWALSLAHAQLSEVFFQKTIQSTIKDPTVMNVILTVATCFMFFMFTFGVLLVMDVLECFLHALRLHWVEFQNKFFYADGIAFKPFSYKTILSSED